MGSWKFALPNSSNAKDGFAMGSRKLTPQDLDNITHLAKSWQKIVVRRAFGEQGPGLDVDLAQMEQMALAAARGVTAGALEEATAQQATIGQHATLSALRTFLHYRHGNPPLKVGGGGVFRMPNPSAIARPAVGIFFPSASPLETGHAWLQPVAAAQDRGGGGTSEIP